MTQEPSPPLKRLIDAVGELPWEHQESLRPHLDDLTEADAEAQKTDQETVDAIADMTLAGERMIHETHCIANELAEAKRTIAALKRRKS